MAKRYLSLIVVVTSSLLLLGVTAGAQVVGKLAPLGTTTIGAGQVGNASGPGPEIDSAMSGDADQGDDGFVGVNVNRSISKHNGVGVHANGSAKFKSNPTLSLSFEGLNLYQQRFANNGNQFTVEPPDQALCVGGGYVLESVNDVLRVFDTSGNPVTDVIDLNTFYGYPPAINRHVSPLQFGPSITDPVCYYDADTQRFYHVVLTLDRARPTSQGLNGRNHLDIAVSNSSNPAGSWTIYSIEVTNNGLHGTPNHNCVGGPCLGDYPHIGADANGIYITTNEFAFVDGFRGAQIYAISKRQLAAGGPANYVLLDTTDAAYQFEGHPGFTVWPAQSGQGQSNASANGTEYFLSDLAVWTDSGVDSRVNLWTLKGTASLDSASPNLSLSVGVVNTLPYGQPPRATQKAGDYPQGQSIGAPEPELAANDTRMQQVYFANGKLWAANGTGIIFDGDPNIYAGIAYYVINPNSAKTLANGYIAVQHNNVTYPAAAANGNGRGIVAFTLTGDDFYPSAAYASLDAVAGAGDVQLAANGAGPWDGFTGYPAISGQNRPRWGDYGAAAVDGNNFWIASEYVAQTCTLAQWTADATCGQTRAPLGNWSTRLSQLQIK